MYKNSGTRQGSRCFYVCRYPYNMDGRLWRIQIKRMKYILLVIIKLYRLLYAKEQLRYTNCIKITVRGDTMDMSSIGKNIRKKRLDKSWKQEFLAEKADVSAPYIGMIERGEKMPSMETFIRIANALDAASDELLCGVINRGYEVRMSKYLEKLKELSGEEQNKVFRVLDVMLSQNPEEL